jgi:SRSO17 transposase
LNFKIDNSGEVRCEEARVRWGRGEMVTSTISLSRFVGDLKTFLKKNKTSTRI